MSNEKKMADIEDAVAQALEVEREAQNETDEDAYVHQFSYPFQWEGKSYEKLTFRWGSLSCADQLDIEYEMLMRGHTWVVPEYTGDYLLGMAARACEELEGMNVRQRAMLLKALPLRDFMRVSQKARSFLLRSGQFLGKARRN